MTRNAWRTTAVTIRDGRGPERVATEDPPADWTPPPPVGFAPPGEGTWVKHTHVDGTTNEVLDVRWERVDDHGPMLWDGDQA